MERPRRSRVAVVDTSGRLRAAFERALHERYDVTTAGSAEAILASVDGGTRFDAILCELDLPEMSGLDLVKALADRGSAVADHVILMTADDVDPRTVCVPLLLKPFDVPTLLAALERATRS